MIIPAGHWRGNLGICDWTPSSVIQADAEVAAPFFDTEKFARGTRAEVVLQALLFASCADEAQWAALWEALEQHAACYSDRWRPPPGNSAKALGELLKASRQARLG